MRYKVERESYDKEVGNQAYLVLIVSNGWQMELSTKPAVPPATRLSTGFFFFFGSDSLAMINEQVSIFQK